MECVAMAFKNSGNTKLRNFIEIKELLATFLTEDSSVEISSSQKTPDDISGSFVFIAWQ